MGLSPGRDRPQVRIREVSRGERDQSLVQFEFYPSGTVIELPVPVPWSEDRQFDEHPDVWRRLEDELLGLYMYARARRNHALDSFRDQPDWLP
jgi:hypothetical protein